MPDLKRLHWNGTRTDLLFPRAPLPDLLVTISNANERGCTINIEDAVSALRASCVAQLESEKFEYVYAALKPKTLQLLDQTIAAIKDFLLSVAEEVASPGRGPPRLSRHSSTT